MILRKLKRVKDWILHKTPELKQLSVSDALLAKIVIDIKREAKDPQFKSVPLHAIRPIHPINRQTAIEKVHDRVKSLLLIRDRLLREGMISNEVLIEAMPSVSPIQVIPFDGHYIAFEGNGRLAALHEAFKHDEIKLEVEEFEISDNSHILEDIKKLQELFASAKNK